MKTSHLSELEHIKVLLLTGFGRYKPEGMRPLGRPTQINGRTKMDFKETGCRRVKWILLEKDRDTWQATMSTRMSLRVP